MGLEKILCMAAMIISGMLTLLFLFDLIVGMPFNRQVLLDILFVLGGAFILWQGVETYREFR